MRLFHAKPDDVRWGRIYKYDINAAHKWGLPGVKCSACGSTWATTGIEYPAVDLSILPTAYRYRDRRPVSIEELNDLRLPIVPLLPPNAILNPGTDLGPLVGKAWGKFGDFAWLAPWTMLMRREVYEKLSSYGVQLPIEGMAPELKFRSKSFPDLVEPQIEPLANLVSDSFLPSESFSCLACGRDSRKLERFIVDGNSVPNHVDLFRTRDHPTYILATELFVNAVQKLSMTDILFTEVDVK